MREAGVRDVRGLPRAERRGAVEQAERIRLRAGREESDTELVHNVGLVRRQIERAAKRSGRRDEVFGLSFQEAQTEVCLPDVRIEREHARERSAHLLETRAVRQQRRAAGPLELGLEIGTLEAESKAMRLCDRVGIGPGGGKDPLELTRGFFALAGGDEHAREMGACREPAVRGGALEVRAAGGLVALLQREDAEQLLRAAELLTPRGDPSQV